MNAGFSPGERCLIGVSGGRDSVVLLHRLREAGFGGLTVCHLDHGLRPESATDARFVQELAASWGYEAVLGREDVGALAERRRISVETAAREARHAFFARIARERDCPRLFLAHHADDQVETFLFNLFRGAAAAGLAAMQPVSTRKSDGLELRISRPLLDTWREEIDTYIDAHRLSYVEDASNSDPRFTRNRLRHEVIPLLERAFGREIRHAVWRAAAILGAEDAFLEDLLGNPLAVASLPLQPFSDPELNVEPLLGAPVAFQRRLLHAWLRFHGVSGIGFTEVEAVRGLLHGSTAKTNLPGAAHARRRAGKLFLERPKSGLSD